MSDEAKRGFKFCDYCGCEPHECYNQQPPAVDKKILGNARKIADMDISLDAFDRAQLRINYSQRKNLISQQPPAVDCWRCNGTGSFGGPESPDAHKCEPCPAPERQYTDKGYLVTNRLPAQHDEIDGLEEAINDYALVKNHNIAKLVEAARRYHAGTRKVDVNELKDQSVCVIEAFYDLEYQDFASEVARDTIDYLFKQGFLQTKP